MTPWSRKVQTGAMPQVGVIPPRSAEELAADPPPAVRPEEYNPRRVFIKKEDLDRVGYTEGCRRCKLMREEQSCR